MAFDLPGLGLADRPPDYDYSWTGLGRFAAAAVDALRLDAFHLVVHDIGGPVGFELMSRVGPDRVRSLTVMNTMVEVDTFERPVDDGAVRPPRRGGGCGSRRRRRRRGTG